MINFQNDHVEANTDKLNFCHELSEFTIVWRLKAPLVSAEREKLQHDLQKMEQFEEKLNEELVVLREKVVTMEKQLDTYSNLDQLRSDADSKKQVGL